MVNRVHLIGNLGKDPKVRHLESGNVVANFSLATSERYKKDGEKVIHTEWHNIVFWGPLAKVCEKYLKKGKQVYVEGRITTRSYKDKDGNKKYVTEIIGHQLQMLGSKEERKEPKEDFPAEEEYQEAQVVSSDGDLPF